ncbi:MAG: hypothetical protein HRU33_12145 [Rhodobacteraceae bacterium]|nr:hypothetical protein [Paracoccaceae bacterium]
MGEFQDIRERLTKLEALFARGATAGERAAAGAALERMQARLEKEGEAETEVKYSLPDIWSVRLFVAICRKHDVKPFRYRRQRRTTVMVRIRKSEFERTVAAEFHTLHQELTTYFAEMVDHLISDVMKSDGNDDNLEQRQIAR